MIVKVNVELPTETILHKNLVVSETYLRMLSRIQHQTGRLSRSCHDFPNRASCSRTPPFQTWLSFPSCWSSLCASFLFLCRWCAAFYLPCQSGTIIYRSKFSLQAQTSTNLSRLDWQNLRLIQMIGVFSISLWRWYNKTYIWTLCYPAYSPVSTN